MAVWDYIAGNESEGAGGYYAKNPLSSATGKYQMTKPFILGLAKKYRPDLYKQGGENLYYQFATNPKLQEEFKNLGDQDNELTARNAGYTYDDRNKGVFWRLGAPDAMKVMSADPNTSLDQLLSPEIMKVNPDLRGRTAGDILAGNGYINKNVTTATKTPMQAAMDPALQDPATGPMRLGPPDQPQDPAAANKSPFEFLGDGDYWKRALIGAGAGLSSIDNPQGAAVAASMLRQLDDKTNRYYTQQGWDGTLYRIDRQTGDTTIVTPGSDALAKKKEGLPDANTANSNYQTITHRLDDMNKNIDALAGSSDEDLGYITGTATSMLPTGPAELSLSGGKAAKLQANYDTLQAQGTLDEVRRLKEQSSTLGQISNYEDQLFQKAFAPINNKMKPTDFRAAIREKQQAITEIKQIMRQKYESIYGKSPDENPRSGPGGTDSSGFKILDVKP